MSNQMKQLIQERSKQFGVIALFGLSILQSCGSVDHDLLTPFRNTSDDSEKSEVTPLAVNDKQFELSLNGIWIQKCQLNGNSTEEIWKLNSGKFTHEVTFYDETCSNKSMFFSTSGAYALGSLAKNVDRLLYIKGDFVLEPMVGINVRNIDFTIQEWTFDLNEEKKTAMNAEIDVLRSDCPELKIEEDDSQVRIIRNGCNLSALPAHDYNIFAIENDQLRLGQYINDVNTFDARGGTTPELRKNVLNVNPLLRIK